MNLKKLETVIKTENIEAFRVLAENLVQLPDELNKLQNDIRLAELEIGKQTESIIVYEVEITESVISETNETGRKLYTNSQQRDVAIKKELNRSTVYQQKVKERTKWKDNLNKLKIQKDLVKLKLKSIYYLADLAMKLRE